MTARTLTTITARMIPPTTPPWRPLRRIEAPFLADIRTRMRESSIFTNGVLVALHSECVAGKSLGFRNSDGSGARRLCLRPPGGAWGRARCAGCGLGGGDRAGCAPLPRSIGSFDREKLGQGGSETGRSGAAGTADGDLSAEVSGPHSSARGCFRERRVDQAGEETVSHRVRKCGSEEGGPFASGVAKPGNRAF